MTQYPAPKLLLNQRFRDMELLSRVPGWEQDFRQLDHGLYTAKGGGHGPDGPRWENHKEVVYAVLLEKFGE